MKTLPKLVLLLALGVLLAAAVNGSQPAQNGLGGDPIVGGRIYDNWMLALDLKPPLADQPLWAQQDANPRTGEITWRCKECHGWDYKGADGAYGPNSLRYTGFPGLQGVIGSSQEEVIAWLNGSNNPQHNFQQFTNQAAVNDLAAFLRTQQLDMALIIDYQTGHAYGDKDRGANLYEAACAACHGERGDAINFGRGDLPLYMGDIASADPWRTVHKIRFGAPATRMPASEDLAWSLAKVADVLAYAQTLPRGNPTYTIFSDLPGEPGIERQGDLVPILWGSLAILLVIAAALAWDKFRPG